MQEKEENHLQFNMEESSEYKTTKILVNFLKLYLQQPKSLEEIQFLMTAFRTMIMYLENNLFQQKKRLKQANIQTQKEFGQTFLQLFICDDIERTVFFSNNKKDKAEEEDY